VSDAERVTIVVDGREIVGTLHQPLVEALRNAGIAVPTLCYHPALTSLGACRLCVVEVTRGQGKTKLTTSCNFPVLPDLTVRTDTDWVRRTRRGVLELLVMLAPGSPELLALAREHGVEVEAGDLGPVQEQLDRSGRRSIPAGCVPRRSESLRLPRSSVLASGAPRRPDLTNLFLNGPLAGPRRDGRCIRCGLCVRVCAEIVGAEALGWHGRGTDRRVATPFDDWTEQCIGCGACAAVCPTDAIHMESEAARRFVERAGPDRLCRYALLGLTPGAVCSNGFQCWRCEVEQRIGDALREHPAFLEAAIDARATVRSHHRGANQP
jgi:ferredoxin